MSDNDAPEPYSENPDHVPNPLYQTGVVDTTGTTGDSGTRIENISTVFDEARAAAFGPGQLDENGERVDESNDDESDGADLAHDQDGPDDDGLDFKSKKEAEQYADDHEIDVDKSLPAAEYKDAVAKKARQQA